MHAWAKILVFAVLAAGTIAHPAPADVIELASGGQIEGRLVGSDQHDAAQHVIETANGGRITVEATQVARVLNTDEIEAEYRHRARNSPDSIEAHWELSEWCRENRLTDESQRHLERILELDPEHVDARKRLGYRAVKGRWFTRDQLMASRGMEMYAGKYRSTQEIELLERQKKRDLAEGQWRGRLKTWYRRLDDRQAKRAQEAYQKIQSIRDPRAADALVALIEDEQNYERKLFLLQVAAQIEHPATFNVLIENSLHNPVEEIRAQCLEYIIQSGRPGISEPYIRALKSADNPTVHRAALALQTIGDRSAISPLIDALVTEHKYVIGGRSGGGDTYAFSPSSGSFSFGGGARVEKRMVKNPAVLSTLVYLSGGESFDYNEKAWRRWLAVQKHAMPAFDMRRDE